MPDPKGSGGPPKPPDPKPAPPSALAPAAESTDPAVQHLIAERASAVLNGDDAAAKAIDERLAELGFN